MQILIDLHSHSMYSPDGEQNSIEKMCEHAKSLGLFFFCVTDHCEINADEFEEQLLNIKNSVWDMESASFKMKDIHCLRGVEMGQATECPARYEQFIKAIVPQTDLIIASLHNLIGCEDFAFLNCRPENVDALIRQYFKELAELVNRTEFDVLGHLTYPLRYIQGESGIQVDLKHYREEIDEVLFCVIRKNKAIEVNTSGLRQKLGDTMPPLNLIRRYRELGGKYITVGSDAHRLNDIGKGVSEATELILQAGFSEVTIFKNHEPIAVSIL